MVIRFKFLRQSRKIRPLETNFKLSMACQDDAKFPLGLLSMRVQFNRFRQLLKQMF